LLERITFSFGAKFRIVRRSGISSMNERAKLRDAVADSGRHYTRGGASE